jgi:uncharacterized protein YbbC (DUF1343 family)
MIALGLESLMEGRAELSAGRFGLLMNQASVDRRFRYAHELLAERFPGRLAALFSPQHGLFGEQQDNMIESGHGRDRRLGVPVHSLYSETRRPTPEMLDGLDAVVIDLQDVGTRVYTFVWTALACLEACAGTARRVIVLDRPNPLGSAAEGPPLDMAAASFVGRAPIPMRHGLTIGELMRWCRRHFRLDVDLEVIPVEGLSGSLTWRDLGRDWVPTSPNLPRIEGVDVYPGQVLLEGTNLSEGRGTTTPFEVCGAPWIDPWELAAALGRFSLPGVAVRPIRFEPTFQKHARRGCGGGFLHVTERRSFASLRTSAALLAAIAALTPGSAGTREPPFDGNAARAGSRSGATSALAHRSGAASEVATGSEGFRLIDPPYEYETEKIPLDMLWGSNRLRRALVERPPACDADLDELLAFDAAAWRQSTEDCRLYPVR